MRAVLVGIVLCLGCAPSLKPLEVPAGCQPLLAGADCLLPYPSDFFQVVDARQPTGFRIAVGQAAAPTSKDGKRYDVTVDVPLDGFSTVPTIVATLGVELSPEGFVTLEQGGERSLSKATSNTLLLDGATFEPVAHFVDLDPRAKDLTRQALVLRAFGGLKEKTRYVVLVAGAKTPAGALAPAPEGFRRLRDGQTSGDPAFDGLSRAFDDRIVPAAKAAGVARSELQLAWEFTTGSREWATRDMLRVRELTLSWLETNVADVVVSSVNEQGPADTFRIVKGTITGPRFCSDNAQAGCVLLRDDEGRVKQEGTVAFPFIGVIPRTVEAAPGPSPVFLYGHGFFGNLEEVDSGAARRIASEVKRTMLATEWWGMALSDIAIVGDALTGRLTQSTRLTERVHQGMANWLVLTKTAERLGTLPAFERSPGVPLVTGKADAYLGISQGHILGGTMNALNPITTKLAFNVGGAGLTTMMIRAEAFKRLFELLEVSVTEPLEQQKFLALIQRPLDRIDPASFAVFLQQAPLPGNAPKQLLMQIGLMDSSVPNLGSWLHARLLGLKVFAPSPAVPYGLETQGFPATSGLQIFDFKVGDADAYYRKADFPLVNTPVHEAVRGQPSALRQLKGFFDDGQIVQTCDGACDPN
ncbi:MAG: hypothetical protein Q8N26_26650 [Myxococcales bacterium]|nr:hypothetical protein [Myxococcales bacterium]